MIPSEIERLANQVALGKTAQHSIAVSNALQCFATLLATANTHLREAYRSDNKTETLNTLAELRKFVDYVERLPVPASFNEVLQ